MVLVPIGSQVCGIMDLGNIGDGTGMVRGWYGDGEGQVITTVTR